MTIYVALLRAIGPATHARMTMADLREGCLKAGFSAVSTYVATGNVIFESTKSVTAVRVAVERIVEHHELSGTCDVFVRSHAQMRRLADSNPFPRATADRPQRVGVCFFRRSPRSWPAWVSDSEGPERISALSGHLIIDYGDGDAASRLQIERDTGERMTQRNWNTVSGILRRMTELRTHR